jgi:steroid delta-isomerase-like uncharacterized protein
MDRKTIDQNIATVTRFFEGTHSGELDVIDETVAENIVTHGFIGGNPASRAQYKQWFHGFQSAFANGHSEMLATMIDSTNVAVHWRVTADHTGPFAGVPASGRSVSFSGMVRYRMENGMIAETWLYADEQALLCQIGAMPKAMAA